MNPGSFFPVTTARAHPALLRLAVEVGGFSKLAPLMGEHPVRLYEWLRGHRMPKTFPDAADRFLMSRVGLTAEQVFRPKAGQGKPEVWKIAQRAGFLPQYAVDFGCDLPKLLGGLTEKQRRVFVLRLAGWSLEDIGDALDVTRERVRQIEARANTLVKARCLKLGYK